VEVSKVTPRLLHLRLQRPRDFCLYSLHLIRG